MRIGDGEPVEFVDGIQGPQSFHLTKSGGDFVVLRADGVFAYQLAVAVDDAWQGVNQVVRGADLLGSTPRQIHLQRLLEYPPTTYAHLPLVVEHDGNKLSKRDSAISISQGTDLERQGSGMLNAALGFLEPTANGIGLPTARVVIDVGDWDASRFVLLGGQSGNPFSPHYDDQVPLWQSGEGIPIHWSIEAVSRATRATLRLIPES